MFSILSLIAESIVSPFKALPSQLNTEAVSLYQFHHDTALNGFIFHRGDSFAYNMATYNQIAEHMENIPANLLQTVEYAVIIDSVLCETESANIPVIGVAPHMGLFF